MRQLDFSGQVAIVTGGGRNLGRGYCLDLARRGASVVVNDIDAAAADAVVAEVERAGGRAVASYATVATADGGSSIVSTAVDAFGTVDVLVNNAGNLRAGPFSDMAVDDFDAVLDVHLRGAFCVTRPAWTIMRERGRGRVVMTGSAGGLYPEEGYSDYAAAKAGLIGFTRALAAEGRDHGIYVNAILPQAGGSSMTAAAGPIASLEDATFQQVDAGLAPYKSVEAVVPLLAYLCSAECTHTGLALAAGAGWFGRVFVGLTSGWTVSEPGAVATAEEIAAHFGEIVGIEQFEVPDGASDELRHIARRLGLAATSAVPAR